jgi:predicted amidophosphoribosyltransferase
VRDKYVVLIDDIVTTGASMAACVSLLIRARARAVVCLSVCYTEKEKR